MYQDLIYASVYFLIFIYFGCDLEWYNHPISTNMIMLSFYMCGKHSFQAISEVRKKDSSQVPVTIQHNNSSIEKAYYNEV